MNQDPYFVVKGEVEESLQKVVATFSELNSKFKQGQVLDADSVQQVKGTLQDINEIETDLTAMDRAISVAENEPWKFKLDAVELDQRKSFVSKSRRRIGEIKSELQKWTKADKVSEKTGSKKDIETSERSHLLGSVVKSSRLTNGVNEKTELQQFARERNDNLIKREIEQQKQLMEQQDETLDNVQNTVHNLKNIAVTIGDEIEDQNVLLEETESRVDNTSSRLSIAQNKVKDVLKAAKADTKNSIMIVCLSIVLIILLVFIIVS